MARKTAIEFPRQTMWTEFWRICEIGLELRMFGWSDRKMPTVEEMNEEFGLFDPKLNVSAYLNDFLFKWKTQHKRDYSVVEPKATGDRLPDLQVRFETILKARANCDGAFGTFHHIMRTAWYTVHKPKEDQSNE